MRVFSEYERIVVEKTCSFQPATKEIRATHDKIYFNEAFPDHKDRRYLEKHLPAPDLFKKLCCTWDVIGLG